MSKLSTVSGSSFPTASILGLIFITLKLLGVISWSWWWVLAPFWGSLVLIALAVLVVFIGAIILAFFKR